MKQELLDNPLGFGHLLLAADTLLDGAAELTIVGPPEVLAPLQQAIDATFLPTVSLLRQVEGTPVPEVSREVLGARTQKGAYLCQHFTCQRPVTSVEELQALIAPLTRRT
jgi:uncharacterized protein YyaL (SSP411 family)